MVDNGQNKIKRTLEKQQKKVIVLIDSVLVDISQEIEDRKKGLIDENELPSVLQLESISNELLIMKSILSAKSYFPTFNKQIVDSWDIHSKLGDKLLGVVQEYKKLN